ncbi:hypothetical protein HYZ64_02690, partial [Candidatus Berkelbacteria bacterium]|nr:hypothetical protein [Candidatus Berkelbacteria bacterium]
MKIKITVILYILIFCCALYGTNVTWSLLQDKTFQKTGYISAESYDENLIFEGLEPAKTVQDTFRWYVGRWCGQIPFFRPITSQLFWLEYRIFGKTNFHWWLGVALLCHIAAMLLAYEVLARLLQDKLVAAFTIVLFSCPPIVHG